MQAINISAPLKEIRVKIDNQEWLDGDILDAIIARDKLLKKFKKSHSVNDELCYKQSKDFVQNLINNKKKKIENKVKESVGRPKELWKNLGFSKATSSTSSSICLKDKGFLSFDLQRKTEIFKVFTAILLTVFCQNFQMLS